MKRILLLVTLLSLLAGCSTTPYPLGMTKEQWFKLTPKERRDLLLNEQKYREEQRLAKIKANDKANERRHQREMAEKKRLDSLYKNPHNGNIVMVNIIRGHYKYGKKGKNLEYIQEDSYQIARGETKKIILRLKDAKKHYITTKPIYLQYALNGNAVYLHLQKPTKRKNQDRITLLRDGKWHCGSHYRKEMTTSYETLKDFRLFVKEIGSKCSPIPISNHRVISAP